MAVKMDVLIGQHPSGKKRIGIFRTFANLRAIGGFMASLSHSFFPISLLLFLPVSSVFTS